ncbi:MAG: hypothetical protein JWN88_839, partial [Frankiales bacterium]|nr:hypothetical protein [Frankiales bacterium]
VAAWLRDATLCGGAPAGSRVRLSSALASLPLLAVAVTGGTVGRAQAAVLTRLINPLGLDAVLPVQHQLIALARTRDPDALAAWVRHQIATHSEPALEHDQRTAQTKRYLQTRNNHDGTIRGSFLLPSEDYETIATVLEPLARPAGLSDTRNAGQRRADALLEAFDQVLRHGTLPDAGGQRPQLSYLLPAGWAAARPGPSLTDQLHTELGNSGTTSNPDDSLSTRHACATAAWTGPQTRTRIETILCDARISRVLLDPTGHVHGLESLSDQITRAQRRALAARDNGCAARGCTRPPAACDAHHLLHRENGGSTTVDNLVLLCRRHHLMWHSGRLQRHQLHVPWLTTARARPPSRAPA